MNIIEPKDYVAQIKDALLSELSKTAGWRVFGIAANTSSEINKLHGDEVLAMIVIDEYDMEETSGIKNELPFLIDCYSKAEIGITASDNEKLTSMRNAVKLMLREVRKYPRANDPSEKLISGWSLFTARDVHGSQLNIQGIESKVTIYY